MPNKSSNRTVPRKARLASPRREKASPTTGVQEHRTRDQIQKRIGVLASYTGDGGVEKMLNNLLMGFVDAGVTVDLLLVKANGPHAIKIPRGINLIRLNAPTSLLAVPAVIRYLRRTEPLALLAAKDRAGRIAILARRIAGTKTRIVLRIGMHLSGSLAGKHRLQKLARYYPVRWLYPSADAIVTVAAQIAEDLSGIGRIPMERFHVIPNPTITDELGIQANAPSGHPWFDTPGSIPRILAAGRLKKQKDFANLLYAFSYLLQERTAHLVIIGEGPERRALQTLAARLGINEHFDLPGFRDNPYAFMRAADVFVLSSRFEGAPNVLVEAMSLGTPVVATDCPSGPREILGESGAGHLVPVGDPRALAAAISSALDQPPDRNALRRAVQHFNVKHSTREYLRVLGITEDGPAMEGRQPDRPSH